LNGIHDAVSPVNMIWLARPPQLGLEPTKLLRFSLRVVITAFSVVQGRACTLQRVHFVLLAAWVLLSGVQSKKARNFADTSLVT
jgi:hypothetical protein